MACPGGEQPRQGADGGARRGTADDRPEAEIAAESPRPIRPPTRETAKGPEDHGAEYTAFARAVRGTWQRGDRARVRSAGPVPGSRFA
ncbi:hypothetical protein [Streptomyces durhamensis]|uniref:hypothetical protein n=1 Tax=Streptomyces durhamensis TaxID=68194 RepID=UPI0004CD4B58|nr:hypothetical protein [Streptomyces durhamensis]